MPDFPGEVPASEGAGTGNTPPEGANSGGSNLPKGITEKLADESVITAPATSEVPVAVEPVISEAGDTVDLNGFPSRPASSSNEYDENIRRLQGGSQFAIGRDSKKEPVRESEMIIPVSGGEDDKKDYPGFLEAGKILMDENKILYLEREGSSGEKILISRKASLENYAAGFYSCVMFVEGGIGIILLPTAVHHYFPEMGSPTLETLSEYGEILTDEKLYSFRSEETRGFGVRLNREKDYSVNKFNNWGPYDCYLQKVDMATAEKLVNQIRIDDENNLKRGSRTGQEERIEKLEQRKINEKQSSISKLVNQIIKILVS